MLAVDSVNTFPVGLARTASYWAVLLHVVRKGKSLVAFALLMALCGPNDVSVGEFYCLSGIGAVGLIGSFLLSWPLVLVVGEF
jgi:hypothetical protein